MNSKEIERIRTECRQSENWKNKNSKERQLYTEMCLRTMIMSCLCYGYNIYTNSYVTDYYESLGKERTLEICKEQEKYFKEKCRVQVGVYTDSEDVTYNSIIEEE